MLPGNLVSTEVMVHIKYYVDFNNWYTVTIETCLELVEKIALAICHWTYKTGISNNSDTLKKAII